MRRGDGTNEARACPFIDCDDPRCAAHFTLGRLGEAFDVCLRRPHACPTFHHLEREHRLRHVRALSEPARVRLTIDGLAAAAI